MTIGGGVSFTTSTFWYLCLFCSFVKSWHRLSLYLALLGPSVACHCPHQHILLICVLLYFCRCVCIRICICICICMDLLSPLVACHCPHQHILCCYVYCCIFVYVFVFVFIFVYVYFWTCDHQERVIVHINIFFVPIDRYTVSSTIILVLSYFRMLLFHIAIAFELTSCCSWKLKSPFSPEKICCCFFSTRFKCSLNSQMNPTLREALPLCKILRRKFSSCEDWTRKSSSAANLFKIWAQPTCSKFLCSKRTLFYQMLQVTHLHRIYQKAKYQIHVTECDCQPNLSSTRTKTWAHPARRNAASPWKMQSSPLLHFPKLSSHTSLTIQVLPNPSQQFFFCTNTA